MSKTKAAAKPRAKAGAKVAKANPKKKPLFFKNLDADETAEQVADAIVEAFLPVINEERRKCGMGPLPE